VYPAIAVLQALQNRAEEVLWVGGEGGIEAELVKRLNVPFVAIPAAGLHGVGLRSLPGNLYKLAKGTLAARQILKEFKPDVLFFTGGYVAAPIAFAGRKIPSLLYVPDIEPGLALKYLASSSDCIAVTASDSEAFFAPQKRIVETGYPTRPELSKWDLQKSRDYFGINDDLPVLLVFGGSKGARSINYALMDILPELLTKAQVIHISGKLDWEVVQENQTKLPVEIAKNYHAYPYLHEEMGAAFTCADLVVSRAGASSLGEFPLFGLPAILVPYPYAWRYQKVNASYLVNRGAALLLEDEKLKDELLNTIQSLFADQPRLKGMKQAMQSLAKPNAAEHIANLALEMAAEKRR
jgi:UDP-N-acetylglucosamine--N-acetylmuramyl-(pentapeptide) pyrophosphoryl-undecaprenol N-acetylglucosamine transferase